MQKTPIEYLTHTWNPLAMRCTPVSEGCKNCWHLRMADRLAAMPPLSNAATENRAAYRLNPHFSRWLMGYQPAWCDCAVTATQSCRKSRRNSSRRLWMKKE